MSHPNQPRRITEAEAVQTPASELPDPVLSKILDEIEAEQKKQTAEKEPPPRSTERPGRQATPYGFD